MGGVWSTLISPAAEVPLSLCVNAKGCKRLANPGRQERKRGWEEETLLPASAGSADATAAAAALPNAPAAATATAPKTPVASPTAALLAEVAATTTAVAVPRGEQYQQHLKQQQQILKQQHQHTNGRPKDKGCSCSREWQCRDSYKPTPACFACKIKTTPACHSTRQRAWRPTLSPPDYDLPEVLLDVQLDNQPVDVDTCSHCKSNTVCNYDLRKCHDCLKRLMCDKCQSRTTDYIYKYKFKDSIDYCQITCKPQKSRKVYSNKKNYPENPDLYIKTGAECW
jgi:hypothetical protein